MDYVTDMRKAVCVPVSRRVPGPTYRDGMTKNGMNPPEMPPSWRRICAAIRALRESKQLTQSELATALEIEQSYVSRWERVRVPDAETLWLIETVGLGLPAGSVLRAAGFIDDPDGGGGGVLDAVDADPRFAGQAGQVARAAVVKALDMFAADLDVVDED